MKTIKTISKLAMLFAFVAFANTLLAGGNLKLNIVPLNSASAVVSISSVDAANLAISIENENGEKVFYKESDGENTDYRKIFNFSQLEEGNYKLSVTANGLISEREFSIGDKNIAVGSEKNLAKPFFAYEGGVLKVTYLNFPEDKLSLNFYSGSDLVYSKKIGAEFNVVEGFDLSKLEKGSYLVELSTESKSYSYNFDVE
jgi:hypothetical protein